ncbi:MAG: hypothetical protein JO108_31670 [Acidobacteriaceae bacterium]|nr:hypothetical protein [Acidobacteriaceae bacterium]
MICSWQVQILLFTTGLALCSIVGSASDLAGQVNVIQNLEREGHLLEAIIETSKLIDALQRSDPQSLLIPEGLDRRASLKQDLGRWAKAEHDYAQAITLWQAAADLFGQGEYTQSARLCQSALDIWANGAPERDRSDLALNTSARIELKNEHGSTGLSFALAALKKYGASRNPQNVLLAAYEDTIALAREANGQLAETQQTFGSALKILEGTEHPPAVEQYNLFTDYARLLIVLHRKKEAKALVRKAHTAISKLDRTASQRYTADVDALLSKY